MPYRTVHDRRRGNVRCPVNKTAMFRNPIMASSRDRAFHCSAASAKTPHIYRPPKAGRIRRSSKHSSTHLVTESVLCSKNILLSTLCAQLVEAQLFRTQREDAGVKRYFSLSHRPSPVTATRTSFPAPPPHDRPSCTINESDPKSADQHKPHCHEKPTLTKTKVHQPRQDEQPLKIPTEVSRNTLALTNCAHAELGTLVSNLAATALTDEETVTAIIARGGEIRNTSIVTPRTGVMNSATSTSAKPTAKIGARCFTTIAGAAAYARERAITSTSHNWSTRNASTTSADVEDPRSFSIIDATVPLLELTLRKMQLTMAQGA